MATVRNVLCAAYGALARIKIDLKTAGLWRGGMQEGTSASSAEAPQVVSGKPAGLAGYVA